MDQSKIGKFIAACRKEQGMTQANLAEKLGISDRAVSKWETGKSMPDSGIMLELCGILGINVNELLSGERIMTEAYDRAAEQNLLALKRKEEQSNRRMLRMGWVIRIGAAVIFVLAILLAKLAAGEGVIRFLLIALGMFTFGFGLWFSLEIDRSVGFYRCGKCGNVYVPEEGDHAAALHVPGRSYLKCPSCGARSWQKKVASKED